MTSLPTDYATGQDRVASVRWKRADDDAAGPRIDEQQLLSIVRNEMESAVLWGGGAANDVRRKLMDLYLGAERGDELPGRSQVRSRSVYETIEWAKPALMALFFSGPIVAEFQPQGEEDDDQAKQRTDVANHIFLRANPGFLATLDAVTDALVRRTGWVKVWHEDSLEVERDRYVGKTEEEIADILGDEDVELDAASEPYTIPMRDEATGEVVQLQVIDVETVRRSRRGRVRVEAVPPNEVLTNREARSPTHPSCRFIEHRRSLSASEVVAMGVPRELVARIPTSTGIWIQDSDDFSLTTSGGSSLSMSDRTDTERRVIVHEAYVKVDVDGDGISEWWKLLVGGDYGEILLDHEPVSDHCFARFQVIPLPHSLEGLGVADSIADLEAIETTLTRTGLDNLYALTQGRFKVQVQGGAGKNPIPMVNLEQLTKSSPGSWVEVWTQEALQPLEQPQMFGPVQEALTALTDKRQARTGISPDALGLDPNAISKHVFGAMAQTSAAMQRIVLMALVAAEGLKRVFELIDRAVLMNPSQPMQLRLRGKWVKVDPSTWHGKMDAEIAVGITSASRFERAMALQSLIEVLKAGQDAGKTWITDENLFNAVSELIVAMGFKNTHAFVSDPKDAPPPEPPPKDPTVLVAAYQHHIETQKLEHEKEQLELEKEKLRLDWKKLELDHEIEVLKVKVDAAAKGAKFDEDWRLEPFADEAGEGEEEEEADAPAPMPPDVQTSGPPPDLAHLTGRAPLG